MKALASSFVRRDGDERRPEQRVRPRREHLDRFEAFEPRARHRLERQQKTFGAADPVRLHQPDLFRPPLQRLERIQQILRVVGNLEHPFGLLALLDKGAGAPAPAVDHLLVGEHGVVHRVPVHFARFAVHETGREHVEEEFLLLMVVFEIAGRDLPRPVERQAHALQLPAHGGDIVVRPLSRMDAALDRRVLRWQAERVPAHGMQHVVAARAHEAGHHVAHGVVPHVTHMDAAGRIRKHLEHIVFRPRIVFARLEQTLVVPGLLPMLFACRRVVTIRGHSHSIRLSIRRQSKPNLQRGQARAEIARCHGGRRR